MSSHDNAKAAGTYHHPTRHATFAVTRIIRDALFMAYHMESTVIEQRYTDILKTEKAQYSEALDKVAAATKIHKGNLVKGLKVVAKLTFCIVTP